MLWLWLGLYSVGALLGFRWTVGKMLEDDEDAAEDVVMVFLMALMGLMGALLWPGLLLLCLPGLITRVVSKTPLGKWVKWFFTLDREERKKIFQ